MGNTIKPKRSYSPNSVPTAADLEAHELAINWADGKAYTKNASGQIVSLTMGGGGGSSVDSRWDLFLPPAPTGLAATPRNAQVSLSWTAPAVMSQTPITDYVVQYSSNSGSTWTTFSDGTSTSTSATVTGLSNGTAYTFRVAAVTGVGQGAWSNSLSATAGAPQFPSYAVTVDGNSGHPVSGTYVFSGELNGKPYWTRTVNGSPNGYIFFEVSNWWYQPGWYVGSTLGNSGISTWFYKFSEANTPTGLTNWGEFGHGGTFALSPIS